MRSGIAAVLLVGLAFVGAAKLPKWLVPCYRDDPKFNECALEHGKKAIPLVVQGDRKFHIPVLDPLEVTELRVDKEATNLGIGLLMTDIKLSGLGEAQLLDYRMDFEKRHFSFVLNIPRITLLCNCLVSGQVLLLPISGNGPTNFTCMNSLINYGIDYDLEKRANGKNYMVLKNSKLDFNTSKVFIKIDNLFNGDKFLGESMNAFLNDNWMEVVKEIGPAVSEALGEATKNVFSKLADVITFEEGHPSRPS